ncbi:ATP-binding protein [Acidimicrobiia bacterium EGI L10123]|uniref:ATP-binding protein n=1 Tax=Salinilacustrithrix flava TaxID=2957203 RepID=UPI003D7C16A6|nr:ATP-binding protein [Acidimicrobiia bacterium EGI L10123]
MTVPVTQDLESCRQRIDDLAGCERSVNAEASFTPGDDYRPVVDLVLAAAEVLDPPLSPARLHDLRLAVTEACSNAVKVHRPEALADPVVVSCHIDDSSVRVEVRDRGPGFDPSELTPLPDPEDPERLRYEHGLGVELICTLADEVAFRREADGTVVVIGLRR